MYSENRKAKLVLIGHYFIQWVLHERDEIIKCAIAAPCDFLAVFVRFSLRLSQI